MLGHVHTDEGAERGTEHGHARELHERGVEVDRRHRKDDTGSDRRSEHVGSPHGARGSAVARAFTVRVGSPTSRRSIVGISRETSTLTAPGLALA